MCSFTNLSTEYPGMKNAKQTLYPEAHTHPGTKCDIHLRHNQRKTLALRVSRSFDSLDIFSSNEKLTDQLRDDHDGTKTLQPTIH